MKYQDELEAGRRSRKPNMSLMQQVEHHRKKLLAKVGFNMSLIVRNLEFVAWEQQRCRPACTSVQSDQPLAPCKV